MSPGPALTRSQPVKITVGAAEPAAYRRSASLPQCCAHGVEAPDQIAAHCYPPCAGHCALTRSRISVTASG
jgi:hypothetical protein